MLVRSMDNPHNGRDEGTNGQSCEYFHYSEVDRATHSWWVSARRLDHGSFTHVSTDSFL